MRSTLIAAISVMLAGGAAFGQTPAGSVQTPEQFVGFKIGADGELARYPKVLEYLQHLAQKTDRVKYEELGKTTLGNPYVLVTFSSPANIARMNRLIEINRRLADPRGLSESEALQLAQEGRTFYFVYATIHSTELGNGQAILEIAHRLATANTPDIREILDNSVVLMVPSQNPDGQVLVIDHYYKTQGTPYARNYPDLYHHYVGHDDNRDWFMFTQKETRLNVLKVQNVYRPQITHDMHQMGSNGPRIFVPPFMDPYDPNVHPILAEAQASVGLAMASALVSQGKGGVGYLQQYDLWTPARQYMVYHGQPRILTEIASVNLADPITNPSGQPFGPQERLWNFPLPYRRSDWKLRDIVEYGTSAVFAGLAHVAKYRTTWLENFYKVHRDWVNRKEAPYAFVIPAKQRDPYETYRLLEILKIGDVEVHRAKAAFAAGSRNYEAGSWVIRLAQPYGAFAKTMLEKQIYPDLRFFPGGPPIPPYDVTGHTLGFLMGVRVDPIDQAFEAPLELVQEIAPAAAPALTRSGGAYLIGPESNAGFVALARLQGAGARVMRSAQPFRAGGAEYAAGSWLVPAGDQALGILQAVSRETGLVVGATEAIPAVAGYEIKLPTRIGLWKAANNMPGGWLKWLFEQYQFNHEVVSAHDFEGELGAKYDVIVLPDGISRRTIVQGLDSQRNDSSWSWAFGVGEAGWQKLQKWVRDGGSLVAIGSASETARELFDLPIADVLPERPARFRDRSAGAQTGTAGQGGQARQRLRDAFQSPASLIHTLEEEVVDPTSLFYCPGSLLNNQFDTTHPVAYGMPDQWPVFFQHNHAYRLKPGFGSTARVIARYPADGEILASGWLLGESYLRDQASALSFRVGRGSVVVFGSEIDFRSQTPATFKMLFNAIYYGPSARLETLKP